jgi:hypothetical protein
MGILPGNNRQLAIVATRLTRGQRKIKGNTAAGTYFRGIGSNTSEKTLPGNGMRKQENDYKEKRYRKRQSFFCAVFHIFLFYVL